jgi:hypothetical protein
MIAADGQCQNLNYCVSSAEEIVSIAEARYNERADARQKKEREIEEAREVHENSRQAQEERCPPRE